MKEVSEIKQILDQAFLAEASYSNFINSETDKVYQSGDNIKGALEAESVSESQADNFIDHWKVIDQQPDVLNSDFSAALFESKDNPGEFTLGIKGTAGLENNQGVSQLDISTSF